MRTKEEHMSKSMSMAVESKIEELRACISRIEQHGCGQRESALLPFGINAIDGHLVTGGLSTGTLHEVSAGPHPAHDAAMIQFASGILARLPGPVLWCIRRSDLFAPGLAAVGLDESRVHYAEAPDEKTLLLLMEEGLRHPGLAGVVGEVNNLSVVASRRLHLAARTSGVTAFVLHRTPRFAKQQKQEPTAAETRWRISAIPSSPLTVAGIGRARWKVELVRSRDSEPRIWEVEACDEKGYVAVPAELADRSVEEAAWRVSA
jgi:protein ImuA